MKRAKVFKSGNSQAVRLPKEHPWLSFKESLNEFTEDFFEEGRQQLPLEDQEVLPMREAFRWLWSRTI